MLWKFAERMTRLVNYDRVMFKILTLGRGGAQVVTVVAFFSDDPSSNPPEAFSFFCNIVFEKNEHKQKRGRAWPTFKTLTFARAYSR